MVWQEAQSMLHSLHCVRQGCQKRNLYFVCFFPVAILISNKFQCVMSQMKENKFLIKFIIYNFWVEVMPWDLWSNSFTGKLLFCTLYIVCTAPSFIERITTMIGTFTFAKLRSPFRVRLFSTVARAGKFWISPSCAQRNRSRKSSRYERPAWQVIGKISVRTLPVWVHC